MLNGEPPEVDPTLQHPRCVFQILKRHYARYTPEKVEEITGVSKDLFLRVCEEVCENSGRERTTALVYAVVTGTLTMILRYMLKILTVISQLGSVKIL